MIFVIGGREMKRKKVIDKKKQGKRNRARGKAFEIRVRKDLESKGWIVFRNFNDVEWPDDNIYKPTEERIGIFKQAKTKWMFNVALKRMMPAGLQTGFPDFFCTRMSDNSGIHSYFQNQFVEVKGGDETHKYLDKNEKEKCVWILEDLRIPIVIANKGKKRGEIVYEDFK